MNVSLYLLLTPPIDSDEPVQANREPQHNTRCSGAAPIAPVRLHAANGFARPQASRCLAVPAKNRPIYAGKLGFAAGVVFNAMGFLLMTSGLLLLLEIAQASLS